MEPSTVLLADDHPVVIRGVRQLLADAPDLTVVAEARTAVDARAAARAHRPDLIVLDLRLGDVLAPDLCRELRAIAPDARILILTAFDDEALLGACLRHGAAGALLKDVEDLNLIDSLRRVRSGETVVDRRLRIAVGRSVVAGPDGRVVPPLTPREHDVLRLLARGLTSREIADELSLSYNTVRGYTQQILEKFQTHNRIEALGIARRLRLI